MRVGVFYDYLDAIGGGEKVALALARRFGADVFTTNLNGGVLGRLGASDVSIQDLGQLPRVAPLKQIRASLRFRRARFPGYDAYVFIGNWAHYANVRHRPGILYCLTPVRAFYDQRRAMLRRLPAWQKPAFRAWTRLHARMDQRSVGRTRRLVAISETVRGRIRRYYGREAPVVYPPVQTARFRFRELGDFWLSANRLYPEKRLDLQFEVFRRLPHERLLVAGGWAEGDHSARYRRTLDPPSNVQLLGEVPEAAMGDLFGRCRGFLATARDEDFGIAPVEAMAAGKVVLATREGGFRETVLDGKTGWLLDADAKAFATRIQVLKDDQLLAMRPACEDRARRFDEERFVRQMTEQLEAIMPARQGA